MDSVALRLGRDPEDHQGLGIPPEGVMLEPECVSKEAVSLGKPPVRPAGPVSTPHVRERGFYPLDDGIWCILKLPPDPQQFTWFPAGMDSTDEGKYCRPLIFARRLDILAGDRFFPDCCCVEHRHRGTHIAARCLRYRPDGVVSTRYPFL